MKAPGRSSRGRRILLVLAFLLVAGASLALWTVALEPSLLEIRSVDLELRDWTGPEMRIALLSDLHVGSPMHDIHRLRTIVEAVNSAKPDLILLAGDYVIQGVVGGSFETPENIAAELASLRAPLGVFAVLGNHDLWLDGVRVRRAFHRHGIQMMDHASRFIFHHGYGFVLVGLGDHWVDPSSVQEVLPDAHHGWPILAFTHNPDVFPQIPKRVALTLAGHTHGGQVRLPFFGTLVVPSQYGSRYARGRVDEDGHTLVVTSGLGTSILPIRFRVRPEVVLLTVRPSENRDASPRR